MKTMITISVVILGMALTACDPGARQARGFRLPEGSIAEGRKAFVALNCHTCHSVSGVELPKPESPGQYQVRLGGEVNKVKTYGELVTAIIHPSHDITKPYTSTPPPALKESTGETKDTKVSAMPSFNHLITAQQLIDLTTFLQSRYKEARPEWDEYHM